MRIIGVVLVVIMPEWVWCGGAHLRGRLRYPPVAVLVEAVGVVGHVLDHAVDAAAAVAAAAVLTDGVAVPRLLPVELVHRVQGIV